MAMTIERDQVKGMGYSVDKDGPSMVRNFVVGGLPNLPTTLYLATISPGIPQMWQAHESIPGLFVNSINSRPLGGDSRTGCVVQASYNWLNLGPSGGQFRLTGSRQVIHANKDPATQKFFTVTYSPPIAQIGGVFGSITAFGNEVSNYCDFDIFTCHLTLEFQRIESGNPKKKATQYVGTTNSDAGWQGIGKAGQWLCESINGEQIGAAGGGSMYLTNYSFQYAPEFWFQLGFYQDDFTHIVPTDIASTTVNPAQCQKTAQVANGIYCYAPMQQAFSGLNIPNS